MKYIWRQKSMSNGIAEKMDHENTKDENSKCNWRCSFHLLRGFVFRPFVIAFLCPHKEPSLMDKAAFCLSNELNKLPHQHF